MPACWAADVHVIRGAVDGVRLFVVFGCAKLPSPAVRTKRVCQAGTSHMADKIGIVQCCFPSLVCVGQAMTGNFKACKIGC